MRRLLPLCVVLAACRSPERGSAPSSSGEPRASAKAPASAAPPAALSLHPWLTSKDAVAVHDVAGGPMVTAGATVMMLGERVAQDPALGEGLEGNAEPIRAVGEFPEATFLVVSLTHRATGAPLGDRAYRWYAKRWAPAASPLHDAPPLAVVEHRGATVALLSTPPSGLRLEVVRATTALELPALPPATDACPSAFVPPRVWLVEQGSSLVIVGVRCEGRAPALLHLDTPPRELPLPRGLSIAAVRARGADVFVAGELDGKAALLRYDGARVTRVETPLTGALTALSLAADGALWIASGSSVAARDAAGAWSVGAATGAVTGVVAGGATRAWISVSTPDGGALLGTTAVPEVVAVPDKRASFAARGQHGKALATSACTSLWVPLVSVGKAGWVPDDLPWLRESVAGKPELAGIRYLAEDDGRETWVGALVPTLAAGDALVADVGARIGIGGQRVTCHTPRDVASFTEGRRDRKRAEPR